MSQWHIPEADYMFPGHLGCPGCGATIAMKFALKGLGDKTIVIIPASCWGIIAGPYPMVEPKAEYILAYYRIRKFVVDTFPRATLCIIFQHHIIRTFGKYIAHAVMMDPVNGIECVLAFV